MDQYIGKMLDNRYELLEVVGTGGMAVVYKAKCHRLNRFVAVKILKPEAAADPELRRRFRDESQAVAMLSHPNIVAVYDVSKTSQLEYIVMELIDGITLKEYMVQRGGKLPWREALHFIIQIMRALRHAHGRGIIHRDIKPHNVMVLRDGSAKVADFGIAHLCNSQNTTSLEALGSVHYISPEQAKGQKVDARTDIYSAGVVLYEMLTGQLPYDGDTPVAVAIKHINSEPVPPRTLVPSIPKGLEQITLKAMATDPEDRFDSARAMLLDLDAVRKDPEVIFSYGMAMPGLRRPDPDETQIIRRAPVEDSGKKRTPKRVAYTEAEEEEPAVERRDRSGQRQRQPRSARAEKERTRKRTYIALAALVIVAFLGVAGIFIHKVLTDSKEPVQAQTMTVPKLVGMQFNEASLTYQGILELEVTEYVEDENYKEGQIITQDPAEDSPIPEDKIVHVTVCKAAETTPMPSVIGMSEADAVRALVSAGVDSSRILKGKGVYSDEPEGTVVSTDPSKGSPLNDKTVVTYQLSLGKEPVTVPQFVGMSRTVAQVQLQSLGIVGSFLEVEDNAAAGTILSQSVSAGKQVAAGTEIIFTVSTGPKEEESETPTPSESTEPSQTPAESSTPAAESPSPSPSQNTNVMVDKSYTVTLPQQEGTVSVQVDVDGVTQYSRDVDCSQGSVTMTLSGSGTLPVEVYIDGSRTSTSMEKFS